MKDYKWIQNAQIVLENGILWDGVILIEDGVIAQVGKKQTLERPLGAQVIDAQGAYVGPGFVNIHVHGGGGYDIWDDPEEVSKFLLSHGETSILSTLSGKLNGKEMLEGIRLIKASAHKCPNVKGINMEGPYMNPAYGANSATNPWKHGILPEEFMPIVEEGGSFIKVWALAPERPGIKAFAEYARKVNPSVIFSLGHSEATPMEIRALGKYRPRIQVHSMNATGRKPVYGGTRAYGPDEYAFKEPDVYCELISDSLGIHVHPEMQQLLLHNKGIHRVLLITDCTHYTNPVPEQYTHVTDLNFDPQGGIAGSKLTMNVACRNIMTHTSCGIAQAFVMASTTPARAICMDDEIGSIEAGKKADLVFVDDKFHVQRVLLGGNVRC